MSTNNAINTNSQIVQFVYNSLATVTNVNAGIPRDDSIPQNTEGVEIITLTITPTKNTSTLKIEFNANYSETYTDMSAALFQDSTADALFAVNVRQQTIAADYCGSEINLIYIMTSGTSSATTFKIRMGQIGTGTEAYTNADNMGNRLMGGVQYSRLTITEYF